MNFLNACTRPCRGSGDSGSGNALASPRDTPRLLWCQHGRACIRRASSRGSPYEECLQHNYPLPECSAHPRVSAPKRSQAECMQTSQPDARHTSSSFHQCVSQQAIDRVHPESLLLQNQAMQDVGRPSTPPSDLLLTTLQGVEQSTTLGYVERVSAFPCPGCCWKMWSAELLLSTSAPITREARARPHSRLPLFLSHTCNPKLSLIRASTHHPSRHSLPHIQSPIQPEHDNETRECTMSSRPSGNSSTGRSSRYPKPCPRIGTAAALIRETREDRCGDDAPLPRLRKKTGARSTST